MTKIKIFFAYLCLVGYTITAIQHECGSFVSNVYDEKAIIAHFEDVIKEVQNDAEFKSALQANADESEQFANHYSQCAGILMKRGQFKAVERIIELLGQLSISINDQLKNTGNLIKKDIDGLVQIATAKKAVQTVVPVFQWAQNRYNLVFQVKFAHRHDSPGCLDTKNVAVDIQSKSLSVSADCVQFTHPLHFDLNVELNEEIDASRSTWKIESVGRLFINITKNVQVIWDQLIPDEQKITQMRVWWDMKDNDQYTKDMETFESMIDDADDKEICMNNKKCKAKREAKKGKIQGGGNIIDGRRVEADDMDKFMKMG
jgi:hypothetical protein